MKQFGTGEARAIEAEASRGRSLDRELAARLDEPELTSSSTTSRYLHGLADRRASRRASSVSS